MVFLKALGLKTEKVQRLHSVIDSWFNLWLLGLLGCRMLSVFLCFIPMRE